MGECQEEGGVGGKKRIAGAVKLYALQYGPLDTNWTNNLQNTLPISDYEDYFNLMQC